MENSLIILWGITLLLIVILIVLGAILLFKRPAQTHSKKDIHRIKKQILD